MAKCCNVNFNSAFKKYNYINIEYVYYFYFKFLYFNYYYIIFKDQIRKIDLFKEVTPNFWC